MKQSYKAFTIIELMITISIAAVLVVMAISGIGWFTKFTIDNSTQEVRSFIAYVRNNAILMNSFMCVKQEKNPKEANKPYLISKYLLTTENNDINKRESLLLKEDIKVVTDNEDTNDKNLVCFYPNGFLLNNSTISPKNSDLNNIMKPQTTTYYASFDYSTINQLKINIIKNDTNESRSICIAKGGEFQKCLN